MVEGFESACWVRCLMYGSVVGGVHRVEGIETVECCDGLEDVGMLVFKLSPGTEVLSLGVSDRCLVAVEFLVGGGGHCLPHRV